MLRKQKSSESGFAYALLTLLAVVVLSVIGFVGIAIFKKAHPSAPSSSDKTAQFVSASPVDPEQMESISKFRSCSGHDYSGKDIDGLVETERSMKNYAVPLKSLSGTTNKVKIFAPFDGVVINNSEGKRGDNVDLSPTAAPGFVYELGHISALKSLPEGTRVKAGQLLGYYNDTGAFDLQFWFGGKDTVNTLNGYFDSLFSHMTPELAKKLTPYGLTEDSLVVSKAERDANPCKGSGEVDMGSTIFAGDRDRDVVMVKNAAAAAGKDTQISPDSSGHSAECAASITADKRPPGCTND